MEQYDFGNANKLCTFLESEAINTKDGRYLISFNKHHTIDILDGAKKIRSSTNRAFDVQDGEVSVVSLANKTIIWIQKLHVSFYSFPSEVLVFKMAIRFDRLL